MSSWAALEAELGAWERTGRAAQFWWRDDDACADTPELARLLALAERHRAWIAIAAIPSRAETAAMARIRSCDRARLIQHGHAHVNHAGAAKSEFGDERSLAARLEDLRRGRAIMERHGALAVLAPPWNRIAEDLVPCLGEVGLRGLSRAKPRRAARPARGLVECNIHVDLIDWRSGGAFVGETAALAGLVGHLADRRQGRADAAEPTGILSHHAVHDAAGWDFLDRLLGRVARHLTDPATAFETT